MSNSPQGNQKEKRWLKRFLKIGGVLAVLTIPLALFWFSDSIEIWINQESFDSTKWLAQKEPAASDWPPRLCMVDNLISSARLDGMTQDEIEGLLGTPSFGERGEFMAFYLGPERGYIRLGSEFLWVSFNERGVVNGYWIFTT